MDGATFSEKHVPLWLPIAGTKTNELLRQRSKAAHGDDVMNSATFSEKQVPLRRPTAVAESDEPQETNKASDREKEDRLVGSFASAAKQLMETM